MKRNNKNGFTLVEMLGVIVIIGLILIVAIPTMSKLIHSNQIQEIENYYTTIKDAAIAYSTKLESKIGNSKVTGCAEIDLQTLIDGGYIEEYKTRDVVCSTSSNGVDHKIKIRNNKGKITVNFRLVCTDTDKNEVVYDSGPNTEDTKACNSYSLSEEINIKTQLDSDDSLTKVTGASSNVTYIAGTSPNNYIWYSGKLWRVVSYNSSTELVKAVTADPITSIYYNSSKESTFNNSDVEIWLNNQFLNTLKDQQQFIVSYNWNHTANSDMTIDSNNSSSNKKLKVGLITTYEYGKIKDWYGTTTSWLLSEGTSGNSLYSNNQSIGVGKAEDIHSVRPTIVFSSDVLVYGGLGTKDRPYIIDNSPTAMGKANDLINTRYSGEYVSLGGDVYRIVSINGETTKIISTFSVGDKNFDAADLHDDGYYLYSTSNIRSSLETDYSNKGLLSYLTNGDFCMDTINGDNLTYRSASCITPARLITTKIGLPKIGDIFTTSIIGSDYWTINPNKEEDATGQAYASEINVMTAQGTTTTATIGSTKATVAVLYLDSSVKIESGEGTHNTPYVLKK